MIAERLNNTRPALGLGLGGVALAVGAWGPWLTRGGASIDEEIGAGPYRIVLSVIAGLLVLLAAGLATVHRAERARWLRWASVPVVAAGGLFVLGDWMLVLTSLLDATHAQGQDTPPTLAGAWGLAVMSVGAASALAGALWRSRREWVQDGPVVTRPGDSEPIRESRLVPGWYDVDGERSWWDGRAWT
ncbi:hypothetical protein [Nigerium massiliense]|uniref:hypothetical protein n=1 Tax=Nigerium massiliense TaxID=1522317 RepID=UPI0005907CCC|nr:hypothetical protein [Nigerium massiliense]